jgi:hypothetical protein
MRHYTRLMRISSARLGAEEYLVFTSGAGQLARASAGITVGQSMWARSRLAVNRAKR